MNNRTFLRRLMHNDKLMLVLSVFLAIVIWYFVVSGSNSYMEHDITGVPVSITLNDYAGKTLKLQVIDGANATATVKVYGPRSVISKLTPADISVTADTGNIISEGTFVLPLKATANGDFTIRSVVGQDGISDTVTVTCDVWKEATVDISTEMTGLSVADTTQYQFGDASITSPAVTEKMITVAGPKSLVNKITMVKAVITETAQLSETQVFTAQLEARAEDGSVVEGVTFLNAEDGKVSVTVPVMVYQKVDLKPALVHAPGAYENGKVVSVSPSSLKMWGVPSELDEYIKDLQGKISFDFDNFNGTPINREIPLTTDAGVQPADATDKVTVRSSLTGITQKKADLPLTGENCSVADCPAGYTVTVVQASVTDITLCGTAKALNQVSEGNLRLTVDAGKITAPGQQTLKARVSVQNSDGVWVYYGETAHGVDVLVNVTAQ